MIETNSIRYIEEKQWIDYDLDNQYTYNSVRYNMPAYFVFWN